jgi:DNA-binding CsgD family transcriptional regulator/tetratricopeptide (TPR) repeat protein
MNYGYGKKYGPTDAFSSWDGGQVITVPEPAWELRLKRALAAGASPEPVLLIVQGAAGTGKSRLVRRILAFPESRAVSQVIVSFSSNGDLVVRKQARRPGTAAPDASASSGGDRPGWTSGAPAGAPQASDPSGQWEMLVGSEVPELLIAEDVHHADGPALALLHRLLEQPPARFACVLTYRPEELAEPGLVLRTAGGYPAELTVLHLVLEPLDLQQVQDLVAQALGEERCPPELAARLHERSGGVAQVVVDLVRLLQDMGGGGREWYGAKDVDSAGIPVRLSEMVLARTAALAERHRPIVWAAAVLDEAVSAAELAEVAGLSAGSAREALLAALAGAALQEPVEDRYGFAVPLAALAVYRALLGPIRQELHRRAAKVLVRRQPVPWVRVAGHRRNAGQTRGWLHAVEMATRQCAELGEYQAAIGLLEETLASPATPAEARARLAPVLADTAVVRLRSDQTVEVLRQIVGDRELPMGIRGEVRLDLGLLLANQLGRTAQAWAELRRAVDELRERPALAARAMAALALPYHWSAVSLAENVSWIERAEVAAAESGDVVMQTAVAANRAAMLMEVGDPDAWRLVDQLPRDSDILACRQQVARGLCNAADGAVWLGHYRRASEMVAEGMQLAARNDASFLEQIGRGTLLTLDWATGRWSGLAARARAFVAEAGEIPSSGDEARVILGLLALARGEWGQVTAWLSGDDSLAPESGAIPLVAASSGALIRLATARQNIEAAADQASSAWARLRKKDVWAWGAELAPWAVEAIALAGQAEAAHEMVAEFAAGLDGRDVPSAQAALSWCHAVLAEVLGQPQQAAAHYRKASAAYATLPRPYAAALTIEGAGRCAIAADSGTSSATTELTTAEEQLDELGAVWDVARVRATLRAHQAPKERQPLGRPSYGDHLSPREQEVAQLAAGGLTNREIAATLHLSPRTVEQHVSRAMGKLGTQSRLDLVRAQARHSG